MSMKIYLDTQIYMLSPAYVQPGGPEALHQFRYYMEKCGYKAKMAYIVTKGIWYCNRSSQAKNNNTL